MIAQITQLLTELVLQGMRYPAHVVASLDDDDWANIAELLGVETIPAETRSAAVAAFQREAAE